jgi:hypothetical protein
MADPTPVERSSASTLWNRRDSVRELGLRSRLVPAGPEVPEIRLVPLHLPATVALAARPVLVAQLARPLQGWRWSQPSGCCYSFLSENTCLRPSRWVTAP